MRNEVGQSKVHQLRAAEHALAVCEPFRAVQQAESLIAQDPTHLPALEVLAKALWQIGDLPRLTAVLEGMIRLNPYEPGYFSLLGAAQQSLGRIGSAIASLSRSIELNSGKDAAVAEMLVDLRRFQATLIEDLLVHDSRFRIEYRRDPVIACRMRGFEIDPPVVDIAIPAVPRKSAFLAARPS